MRTLCAPSFSTLTIWLAKEVFSRWNAKDETTSSAVMSRPLWNFTPFAQLQLPHLEVAVGLPGGGELGSTSSFGSRRRAVEGAAGVDVEQVIRVAAVLRVAHAVVG
jgi:hypothetical protein